MLDMSVGTVKLRRVATTVLVVTLLGAAGACILGVVEWIGHGNRGLGLALAGSGLACLLLGVLLYCQLLLILKFVSYCYRAYDTLLESTDLLRRQETHVRLIADNSSLSDWAKRLVYREKDYEFVRDTIQSALVRQDWELAEHLIRDLGEELGYRDEAAYLDERLEEARRSTTEERVAAAVHRFRTLCGERKWSQAQAEFERMARLFPDSSAIADLPQELEEWRSEVKQQLLREYDEAVRHHDIDRAHALLYQLDQYLVAQEAEALKESARGVFKARLERLKTQFTMAVSYRQLPRAIDTGQQLVREFPNSGYAQEISKLLPILRERAKRQSGHATIATSGVVGS